MSVYAQWTRPELAIPSAVFPNDLARLGFLTPTPLLVDERTIRVYGGMRASSGISRIGWAEIDLSTRKISRVSLEPAIDLGLSGEFDDHGMILGDVSVDPQSGEVILVYVGFQMVPGVKFRAYSGLARSSDGGQTFSRDPESLVLGQNHFNFSTDIAAIHSVRTVKGGWEALVAIGDGWESINSAPFPRYNVFQAHGKCLHSLQIDQDPLLSMPHSTYRLGRPRLFAGGGGDTVIVATGGKRDGDYRPYAFKNSPEGFRSHPMEWPVYPGCSDLARRQAAYPTQITTESEEWVFFNGDSMGRAGALVITRPRADAI